MSTRKIELNIGILPPADGFGSAPAPHEAHRRIMGHYASPLLLRLVAQTPFNLLLLTLC